MFRFDQFSISRRIAMIAGVPFLAALAFGAFILLQGGRDLIEAQRLARTVDVGPMMGAFVHQAQIERGLTTSVLKIPTTPPSPPNGARRLSAPTPPSVFYAAR